MSTRLKINTLFIKRSLSIIHQHKKLLVLPIINLCISIGLFALIATPVIKIETIAWKNSAQLSVHSIIIFFVFFIIYLSISSVIALLFHVAESVYITNYINKKSITLLNAFLIAIHKFKKIYYYKLLVDTFFLGVRLLEYWMDNWSKTKFANQTLAGLRVRIVTYLMIPILSNENMSVWKSFNYSAQLTKNTWGTSIRPRMTANITIHLLYLFSLIPALITLIIGGKTFILAGIIISVILFLCVSTLYATIHIILINALYLYAKNNNNVEKFYEKKLLEEAFQKIEG